MKVKERLDQKRRLVDQELKRILSREDSLLFQAMRYSVFSGGKRFRPLLTLSSGECFEAPLDVLLHFACALELIHNYSLVHDDLPSMDDDDFRRGKPSSHKVFGEGTAILTGDGLLTLAFEVMATASVSEGLCIRKHRAIEEVSRLAGVDGMIKGQVIDITYSPGEATEESVHELIQKKTGSLIVASVKIGAILGKASDTQLEAIASYGEKIGYAFQIRDDITDSSLEREKPNVERLDYVSFFGLAEANRRLKEFVEAGLRVLNEASLESEELRYLALRLLDEENGR